jgi:hypothetical protein
MEKLNDLIDAIYGSISLLRGRHSERATELARDAELLSRDRVGNPEAIQERAVRLAQQIIQFVGGTYAVEPVFKKIGTALDSIQQRK